MYKYENRPDNGTMPPLLTVKEAAAIARVTEKHIRHLFSEGAFKARKVGGVWRVNTESFMAYVGLD